VNLATGYARIDLTLKYMNKYANISAKFNAYQIITLLIIYQNLFTALCFMDEHTRTPTLCVWLPHDFQNNLLLFPSVGISTS
jgi:hypothetical protein